MRPDIRVRAGAAVVASTLLLVGRVAAEEPDSPDLVEEAGNVLQRANQYFNPQISVILQGLFTEYFSDDEDDFHVAGVATGSDAGPTAEGFALGESELALSANADDLLFGFFNLAFEVEDGDSELEVEEAFVETLALPHGFAAKGGQFLSAIGYHNALHSHAWDFVDPPLVYDALLDRHFLDAGAQLSWLAPLDLYVQLGAEGFGGDDFPGGGRAHDGKGSWSVFGTLGDDVSESLSWQAGLSYLWTNPRDRRSEVGDDQELEFSGDSDVLVADLVWKWAPQGNFKNRYFVFQTEYMWRHEDGRAELDSAGTPFSGRYDGDQHGFYASGVYQFHPRWRFGVRYGQLFSSNDESGLPPTTLEEDGDDPRRITAMMDFSYSEFSRFRVQYAHQDDGIEPNHMIQLQFIVSLGAHGAHAY